jgi:lysophospholipase L1-like esterase
MKWLTVALLLMLSTPLRAGPPQFKPADGDRIVFVGGTLVERDQTYSYFETLLNLRFPAVHFTFRNLGWSGDTVWGEARAAFGTPKDGYASLLKLVNEDKPTILLVNYGMNESFDGAAGLSRFVEGYNALLDDLAKTEAKIWLISPNPHEDLGRPLPDPTEHNKQLKLYSQAIGQIASSRGIGFVNLFETMPDGSRQTPPHPYTDNGMHFTAEGSRKMAEVLLGGLLGGKAPAVDIGSFSELRQTIIEKNREYFYRWRPQNETYIFGFRKKEQGQNAVEIPQFDPIVQKLEAKIDELKKSAAKSK